MYVGDMLRIFESLMSMSVVFEKESLLRKKGNYLSNIYVSNATLKSHFEFDW
jgi:hypothetical protein